MERSKELESFNESLGKEIYGLSPAECIAKGLCVNCGELALPKCYSGAGRKEFSISGLCEVCFDSLFDY